MLTAAAWLRDLYAGKERMGRRLASQQKIRSVLVMTNSFVQLKGNVSSLVGMMTIIICNCMILQASVTLTLTVPPLPLNQCAKSWHLVAPEPASQRLFCVTARRVRSVQQITTARWWTSPARLTVTALVCLVDLFVWRQRLVTKSASLKNNVEQIALLSSSVKRTLALSQVAKFLLYIYRLFKIIAQFVLYFIRLVHFQGFYENWNASKE